MKNETLEIIKEHKFRYTIGIIGYLITPIILFCIAFIYKSLLELIMGLILFIIIYFWIFFRFDKFILYYKSLIDMSNELSEARKSLGNEIKTDILLDVYMYKNNKKILKEVKNNGK